LARRRDDRRHPCICAYANNQWGFGDVISKDPEDSAFTKAMEAAEFRTASILDEGGVTFKRIWCGYEIILTSNAAKGGIWCVYNAHEHKYTHAHEKDEERSAVGIVTGGAPIDCYIEYTSDREKYFLFTLITKALSV